MKRRLAHRRALARALYRALARALFSVLLPLLIFGAAAQAEQRILYIGDSHSGGPFGVRLDELLRTLPETTVSFHAATSSAPAWWLTGTYSRWDCYTHEEGQAPKRVGQCLVPSVKRLYRQTAAEVTIIALGANLAPLGWSKKVRESVRLLLRKVQLHQNRCVWIGPPDSRVFHDGRLGTHFDEVYAGLAALTAKFDCAFIDMRPLAHYPARAGDGLHYNGLLKDGDKIARAMAEAVFGNLQDILGRF